MDTTKVHSPRPTSDSVRNFVTQFESSPAQRLRLSLDRLRQTYLTRPSTYSRLRSLLPALVLALAWFWAAHFPQVVDTEHFLGLPIALRHLLLGAEIAVIWNLSLYLTPIQARSPMRDLQAEIWRLIKASIASGAALYVAELLDHKGPTGITLGVAVGCAFAATSLLLLFGFFCVSTNLFHNDSKRRLALIVGTGKRAAGLREIISGSHAPLEILGCLDTEYVGSDKEADGYLGGFENLEQILKENPVELVLIGLPVRSMYQEIQDVIALCEKVGVESHYRSDIFETAVAKPQPTRHSPGFTVLGTLDDDPRQPIKRAFDFAVAFILLIVASPVMVLIALGIKLTSPGPIFFVQKRYGRHRKQFPMFKFRTMVVDAEKRMAELEALNEAQGPVFKMKKDPRISGIGAILRKTSLDELPQLFNILRGEMSLVGPRPLPLRDVSRFEEAWLLRRFSVRPGLTCLWQVGGRSNTTFDEWIKLDLQYIDNWSLSMDLSILGQTIPAVLRGSGAM